MPVQNRDFTDSGLGSPSLAYVPAPSDAEGQESGIAQFGQLHPGPIDPVALRIERNNLSDGLNSLDQASDRYAILTHIIDTAKAYQILPVDQNRKKATLQVPSSQNKLVGGATQVLNPGNPAAGANFGNTLPGTQTAFAYQVLSVSFTLTTSATVANRTAAVTIAGTTFSAAVAQTASLVETYNFAPGNPATTVLPGTGGLITAPIPSGLIVPAGGVVASAIAGIQAADQISNITIQYILITTGSGIVIGSLELIDAVAGAIAVASPIASLGFPLYVGGSAFVYTSKASLYGCSINNGIAIALNTIVERFNSGTGIGS